MEWHRPYATKHEPTTTVHHHATCQLLGPVPLNLCTSQVLCRKEAPAQVSRVHDSTRRVWCYVTEECSLILVCANAETFQYFFLLVPSMATFRKDKFKQGLQSDVKIAGKSMISTQANQENNVPSLVRSLGLSGLGSSFKFQQIPGKAV